MHLQQIILHDCSSLRRGDAVTKKHGPIENRLKSQTSKHLILRVTLMRRRRTKVILILRMLPEVTRMKTCFMTAAAAVVALRPTATSQPILTLNP